MPSLLSPRASEEIESVPEELKILFYTIVISILAIKLVFETVSSYRASKKFEQAEDDAFNLMDGVHDPSSEAIGQDREDTVLMSSLFNLYGRQIEKYLQATQSRATWSFILAVSSMLSGLWFIYWGGLNIIGAGDKGITAGAVITTLGGGISAYITKTFLDVHKLSLTQLNQYFKQPAINYNILMAQRLANEVNDEAVRKEAYKNIIDSITTLIDDRRIEEKIRQKDR